MGGRRPGQAHRAADWRSLRPFSDSARQAGKTGGGRAMAGSASTRGSTRTGTPTKRAPLHEIRVRPENRDLLRRSEGVDVIDGSLQCAARVPSRDDTTPRANLELAAHISARDRRGSADEASPSTRRSRIRRRAASVSSVGSAPGSGAGSTGYHELISGPSDGVSSTSVAESGCSACWDSSTESPPSTTCS